MSPKLPRVKARDLMRVARKIGFEFDRQSGSHVVYFRKSDKRRVVISVHPGKEIKTKTLFGIIRDMGLENEEFKELL